MAGFAQTARSIGRGLRILMLIVSLFLFVIAVAGLFLQQKQAKCADINAPPDKTIEVCTNVIQSNGATTEIVGALSNRGLAYTKKNQYDLALKDLNRAIGLDPNSLAAFTNRGVVYTKLNQSDLAIQDFTQALSIDPHHAVVLNDRGNIYKNNGQYDLALKDLDEAIQNKPDFADALTNRGAVYILQKNYDKALQDINHALQINPANTNAIVLRGVAKADIHNYGDAIEDYNHALALKPSDPAVLASILALRAESYLNKGQYDAVKKDLEDAFHVDPNNVAALAVRSSVYVSEGDFHNGIVDLDQAIHYDSKNSDLFVGRGIANLYNGRPDSSIEDFLTALRLEARNEKKIFEIIWLHLARNRAGQNDQQEFEHNSTLPLPDKWPLPLLTLYRGSTTVNAVSAKAKDGNAAAQRDQACDFDFYVGKFYLQEGQKDKARSLFQAANSDCELDENEHGAALNELKTMTP